MSNSIKTPEIKIFECIEGAKHAKGFTVIIDVFRAFLLNHIFFHEEQNVFMQQVKKKLQEI